MWESATYGAQCRDTRTRRPSAARAGFRVRLFSRSVRLLILFSPVYGVKSEKGVKIPDIFLAKNTDTQRAAPWIVERLI